MIALLIDITYLLYPFLPYILLHETDKSIFFQSCFTLKKIHKKWLANAILVV